jgi:hypothetical protein
MRWEPMPIEEFAGYRRAEGMKLVKVDDIWWAEVRPFFYRPLFPFCEIPPRAKRYPWKSLLGGYLHLVPAAVQAKSCICFHVYDEVQNYSLDVLSSKRRKRVRDSLSKFVARPLEDPDEFVENGYEVYKIFYQRTGYWYKSDRIKKGNFRAWAHNLYDYPKINKTGIYLNDTLCGVETSYRLEDIIFGDNLFTDDVSLQSNVVDFLIHRLREAASCTDAKYFFSGLPTGVTTLDNSNSKKGCKLLRLPAYCKINPLALTFARLFMKDSYRKLLTVLAQDESGCAAAQEDSVN